MVKNSTAPSQAKQDDNSYFETSNSSDEKPENDDKDDKKSRKNYKLKINKNV